MRSVVRRTIILTALASLLLGAVGAPTAVATSFTDTTVAGINVDTTTIPELETHMNHGDLT